MAQFPEDLLPTGRTYTPGVYPHTAHRVLTGREVRIRHSNTSTGTRLRLAFTVLTTAEMLEIRDHYAEQLGGFLPFTIPDDLLLGTTAPANFTPAGHRWIYASSPTVEDVPLDEGSPLNRHNVEIELEGIPPENAIVSGFRLRAVAAWSPGAAQAPLIFTVTATWSPGIAGAILPGLALTATATWEPGRGPVPGADWTATATWEAGVGSGLAFADVSLLLPCNGTNGSTTFTDVSNNAFAVTPAGHAQISTVQSKWGGSSGRFDGAGDSLSIAYASALDLLGNDFTVECWVRIAGTPYSGGMRIVAAGGGAVAFNSTNGIHWLLQAMSDNTINMQVRTGTIGGFSSSNTWTINAWSHVALCFSGSTAYLGLDGTVTSSTIAGISRPSGNPVTTVGTINGEAGNFFTALNGNVNDVRIINGIALYTGSTYTVPPGPHPTS
jgi:hypothetical protein